MTGGLGIFQRIGRYIMYGKQIGKTAANGTRVYARGGATTAINAEGNIARTTKKTQIGKYMYETTSTDYLPFGKTRTSVTRVQRDGKHWQSTHQYSDSKTVPGCRDHTSADKLGDGRIQVTKDRVYYDPKTHHVMNQRTTTIHEPKKTGNKMDTKM